MSRAKAYEGRGLLGVTGLAKVKAKTRLYCNRQESARATMVCIYELSYRGCGERCKIFFSVLVPLAIEAGAFERLEGRCRQGGSRGMEGGIRKPGWNNIEKGEGVKEEIIRK